jgi:hypothetical protein
MDRFGFAALERPGIPDPIAFTIHSLHSHKNEPVKKQCGGRPCEAKLCEF